VYRGDAGNVTFDPMKVAVKDGKARVTVAVTGAGAERWRLNFQ
jgi:hypothetical protein